MTDTSRNGLGTTSLLLSYASKGNVTAIKELLDEDAAVNASDYDGRTALHLAASEGHVPVVELLLKHGADVNPVDRWGDTPLADARKYTKGAVAKLLEQHGGRVEDKKKQGASYDDLSAQYEIDGSELEPLPHIPALWQNANEEFRVVNWRGTKVVARYLLSPLTQDPDFLTKLKVELLMLERLRHPNILQFLGAVTRTSPPTIVTEYLPRGDLHTLMSKGRLSSKQAQSFALDIARGINYLHEHKDCIVHGNLRPRNLLQNEAGQLKVSDFGLLGSKSHADGTGTYEYMAPEVYRKEQFDKSIDTFAFGLIVYEMYEGLQSMDGNPETLARKRALDDVRPSFNATSYPPGMQELIAACWHKDPSKRPQFSEIIRQLEDMKPSFSSAKIMQKCQCAIL
ncbi:hypothetical protein M758_8G024900 [Ceratodon purpureus]|uniref:Protein kinase domain-containing protein n=1 Tax=Ceratodon purpureus TaxID=3225 RepID=A0A8T0H033_CERPU|nr:hypothetical protein KC19_8G027600 [Ceratodon purpureus]KAG0563398.1 hypothetical protein KC19_8G027600 [Ceratodon purpureus]KAG0607395.1 hypothetical protein M758_8G024900 [Ceratodon purpureus]KAG0607396.1 hypothetical protein M758_8G024900 [Ceratodon purpureus]KAG0607397.1 hypothetical protein M758_8G024900 [Ceratodon purpureus]